MQQPAQDRPSPTRESFAGLLSSLTSPAHDGPSEELEWASGELGEGVALLSYEEALRAHGRYRPSQRDDLPFLEIGGTADTRAAFNEPEISPDEALPADANAAQSAPADRDLRSASVTIRLSQAECARLHRRSAEAGLTVSAYLRSCALEAEALRAQVKAALAQLKNSGTNGPLNQAKPGLSQRPSPVIQLNKVLGHIGTLWLGFSSAKRA